MGEEKKYNASSVPLAYAFILLMLFQMIVPTTLHAVTSGPTQPEVQGFTQYGSTNMVDPFTGSFSYNIPLLEIPGPDGGYPINLSYSSGISMDQEASWVGLGWTLNVGAINRQMRGLPDDFDGDVVRNKKDMKPNTTIGIGLSGGVKIPEPPENETAGFPFKDLEAFLKASGLNASSSGGMKFYYNTYNGFGYTQEGGFNIGASKSGFGGSIGINMSQDYFEGGKISPTVGLSYKHTGTNANVSGGLDIGMNFSSRYGLQGVSLNANLDVKKYKEECITTGQDQNGTDIDVEKETVKGGGGSILSTNLSFSGAQQSPSIHDEMKSSSFSASLQLGGQVFVLNIDGEVNGFWNKEELAHNNEWVENNAYGYNYLQDVSNDEDIMDFHRVSDQPVSPSVKTIAQPNLTYDIFSVRGQGIGTMLRPYRSDIGMLRDNNCLSDGWGASLALEVGIGNIHHGGVSGFGSTSDDFCGEWKEDNDITDLYKFKESESGNPYYQPVAYQSYGEKHAIDIPETVNLLQGFKPTYINLNVSDGVGFSTKKELVSNTTGSIFSFSPTTNVSKNRIPRNISVQHFSNEELNNKDDVLRQFDIRYTTSISHAYDLNYLTDTLRRNILPQKQLGGFEAINTSGIRYIYGIPAYNLENLECIYSAKKEDNTYPLSEYKVDVHGASDPDHSPDGYESYLEKNEIPKYAHSFLLTSVLGTDYIDIDSNGVSEKDLGYWVKFNYLKANGDDVASGPYLWRAPFSGGNLNEKLLSKNRDDVGTYTFGKRENWYVSSIETKTHVAEFYISTRTDARGAAKEIQSLIKEGDINTILGSKSYKLDSIRLFTKPERYNSDGSIKANAIPLKTVHFEYAASVKYPAQGLCKFTNSEGNSPNDTGKLTLKSVWFSYRNNDKGKFNGYVFDYHEGTDENPNYNPYAYNRWGDYQPDDPTYTPNKYFPYVRQDLSKSVMDERAAVWNLKEIVLPTGAIMKINYEANDYAYVQNKPAMQMYKIIGVGDLTGISGNTQNYNWASDSVFFDIPDYFTDINDAKTFIRNNYLDNTNQLYFKIKVDLTGGRGSKDNWEFVSGYATIKDINAEKVGTNFIGCIILDQQKVKTLPHSVHPFAAAAWNYLLMNRHEVIEGENTISGNPEETNKSAMLGMMLDIFIKTITSIIPKVQNYYVQATQNNFGLKIDLNSSFIRLNNVTGHKYGGGSRVKEIELIAHNSNNEFDTLGTVYDYSTIEKGKIISSGVAAYEPLIGGDENALKQAVFYENKVAMRNYIPTFSELPLNESYYPSASVGYSKVTVRSRATDKVINGELPGTIPTTGETVHQFYTAKDFPTATSYTPLVPVGNSQGNLVHYTQKIIIPVLGGMTDEQLTISQGFLTEINDMHGKPSCVTIYAQNQEGKMMDSSPVSYQKYLYKSSDTIINGYPAKKLNSVAKVMYDDTTVLNKFLGMDYEYFGDTRISETTSENEGLRLNLDDFLAGPGTMYVPTGIPSYGKDEKTIRLAATNKIIHRFGILDSIIQVTNGSVVKTTNELYDAYTGEAVLTKLNDEYGNSTYNYTEPAYWQYDGMGPAFKNTGLKFTAQVDSLDTDTRFISLNVSNDPKVLEYITSGDELAISERNKFLKAYVVIVDSIRNKIWIQTKGRYRVDLLDYRECDPGTAVYDITLIRSGRKNLLTIPAGTIISKVNPITNRTGYECK